jgi:hypothetical protein
VSNPDPLSPAALWSSLTSCGLASQERAGALRVEELSPGLGLSKVLRVHVQDAAWILKIPDWGGESLIAPRDPRVGERERLIAEAGIAERLPAGLAMAPVSAIERRGGRTWMWMRDLGPWLAVRWGPRAARRAAERCALLHELYLGAPDLQELPWLGREEYAAYAHHVPQARRNLGALAGDARWADLLPADSIPRLREALDMEPWLMAEMRRLPPTFVHGDFHIRNLGFSPEGSLLAIDWANFGIAPLGSDLAAFLSVYRLFGGRAGDDAALERSLLDAYVSEVERIAGRRGLRGPIERAGHLWHLLWGLHLRLGPGLTALLGDHIAAGEDRRRAALDVRSGCLRALAGLSALPVANARGAE